MRATLLTAQRMADSIVKEAEAKRDQLMAQAESDAREKISRMQAEVVQTQERLKIGQRDLAQFISAVRAVCQQELDALEQLPELPVAVPVAEEPAAPTQEETVGEIEQNIYAAFTAVEEETAAVEEPAPEYPEGNPFAVEEEPVVDEPTRRLDLKELKFGRNYTGE